MRHLLARTAGARLALSTAPPRPGIGERLFGKHKTAAFNIGTWAVCFSLAMQLLKLRGERVEAEAARDAARAELAELRASLARLERDGDGADAARAAPALDDALAAAAKSLRAKPALVRAEVARVVRASQQRAPAEEELALFAAVETASAPPAALDAKKAAGMV